MTAPPSSSIASTNTPPPLPHRRTLPLPQVANEWTLTRKIAHGAQATVYEAVDPDKRLVAVKLQSLHQPRCSLDNECEVYLTLHYARVRGVPSVLHYGAHDGYNALVLQYLGPSLEDLRRAVVGTLPVQFVMAAGIEILKSLEEVHRVGLVHGDLKPANVLTGSAEPERFYLADFGHACRYLNERGDHKTYAKRGYFSGSVPFASRNALEGGTLSRRDDLESLAYMIVFLMKGLPWRDGARKEAREDVLSVWQVKRDLDVKRLCEGLPQEVTNFVKQVRKLGFEEHPPYDKLRSLLRKGMRKERLRGIVSRLRKP